MSPIWEKIYEKCHFLFGPRSEIRHNGVDQLMEDPLKDLNPKTVHTYNLMKSLWFSLKAFPDIISVFGRNSRNSKNFFFQKLNNTNRPGTKEQLWSIKSFLQNKIF